MSKFNENGIIFPSKDEMMTGYQDMGILNSSLSEEGLEQDRIDLESYEKYLVESE